MNVHIVERVYHNLAWAQFLRNLKTDHDREIAGQTMDWIKKEYPQLVDILNGYLVKEYKREG